MRASVSDRVNKHRDALRASGLRPIQIWVPDTRLPEFADECRRQSLLVVSSDLQDAELHELMDQAWSDVEGWVA